MSRQPTLQKKLRRDIRRQWPQFTALVVTVMLGIALYAASSNAYQNLQASYDNIFAEENFADLFVTGGEIEKFATSAEGTDGVDAVTTRVQQDLPMEVDGTKFTGRVISYPASGTPDVEKLTSLSGAANPSGNEVLIEQHFASDFELTEGDSFLVIGVGGQQQLTVGGIVATAEYLWPSPSRQEPIALPGTFGVAYATPELTQALSRITEPNQALVLLTDSARDSNGSEILDGLTKTAVADGANEVLTRAEQPSNSLLQEDISGFEQMAVAFPAMFLSASALAMYVLLTRRVKEERPLIGMFRAQGMTGRTIAVHYLKFGLYASLLGALIGLPLGILGAGALSRAYIKQLNFPESLMVITPFRWDTILIGFGFALVAGALASLAPAMLASRVTPADAMRGEPPIATGHMSLLERVIPPVRRAPARWRLIIRSISRNKKRALFTAMGVTMALILILVSWLMIGTMNGLLNNQFGEVQKDDGQVIYSVPVTDTQLDRLADISGVTDTESSVNEPVAVKTNGDTYSTIWTAFDSETQMHGFTSESGESITLPDDGVLITESIQAQIPDIAPGDQVTLNLPGLNESKKVTVVDLVSESLGTFVYSSKEFLDKEFGPVPPTTALLKTTADADQDHVQETVQKQPDVVAYTQTAALKQLWNSYAGLFYLFVGAMLVLGGLMAFAIIFTTMSVNIVERQRELATLRAAGVRQRTLAGLVGGENLIIAGFGVIPGLILGVIGAKLLLASYSNDQFTLDLVVNPWTLVAASLAIMLVAVISQWPGLRAIKRMNIAQTVRERSS